jgi:hypothetical protein
MKGLRSLFSIVSPEFARNYVVSPEFRPELCRVPGIVVQFPAIPHLMQGLAYSAAVEKKA